MGAAARRSWDEKLRAHHGGVFIRRRCLPIFRHAGLRADGCSAHRYTAANGDTGAGLLDRDHRHRGDAPLDDHQLLLDLVLESTLQGPSGTRSKAIAMTEIIRTDAQRRSAIASLALGGLVVGVVWFSILSVIIALQVLSGFEDGQADTYMAVFLGMVFLLLTVALDIYRKEFMPDELI